MLVCIFLRGGADTLNLLVPRGDDASGSHFVVQDRVEHGESGSEKESGGWIARYLRSRTSAGALGAVAIGERIPEALRGAPQATALRTISEIALQRPRAQPTLRALYAASGDALLTDPARATFDLVSRIGAHPGKTDGRTDDDPGAGLHEIARLVHADVGLDVACIDVGGWDTHFVQAGLHATATGELARALAGFESALGAKRESVTTVVMTEFGRRSYENGSGGTDHGRGYAMMVLGSKRITGGKVHGTWPGLDEDSIGGPGGLRVLTDYRHVLADVVEENGASRRAVFPSLPP